MTTTTLTTFDERVAAARKLIAKTKRKATTIAGDEMVNITTRRQRAERLKAGALDQVADILAGKD